MGEVSIHSYAKVNLFLKICSRRPDGYHDIETVFEAINLKDIIHLKIREDNALRISSNSKDIPLDASNLAFRAANALKERGLLKSGLDIHIEKNIPVSAGLGGGSSDAAGVLLGLRRLLKLKLADKEMLSIAAELGADVPFFMLRRPAALGEGRGDVLRPLDTQCSLFFVIICPPIKVLTADAYGLYNLSLTRKKPSVKMIIRALKKCDIEQIAALLYNDFDNLISSRYTQVRTAKEALRQAGAGGVLVSGSGPSVIGLVQSRREAMGIRDKLQGQGYKWRIFVCETVKTF